MPLPYLSCFFPLLLRMIREGAILPQNCTWLWLTPYAVSRWMLLSSHALVLITADILQQPFKSAFSTFPTKCFLHCFPGPANCLRQCCYLLKSEEISIFLFSLLKQGPFSSRLVFNEIKGLASLVQVCWGNISASQFAEGRGCLAARYLQLAFLPLLLRQ